MNTTQRGFAEAVGLNIPIDYDEGNARCRGAAGIAGRMSLEKCPIFGLHHMLYAKIGGQWVRFYIDSDGTRRKAKSKIDAASEFAALWRNRGDWRKYLWFNDKGAKIIEKSIYAA